MHRPARRTLLTPTVALGVTVLSLLTAAPALAAPTGVGGVSGTVTYRSLGVAGIVVTARTPANQVLATTTSGDTGSYTLTGVPAGVRSICFDGSTTVSSAAPLGYGFRCFRTADTPATAVPVRVVADAVRSGVDVDVWQPALVRGTVVDPAGEPVAGVTMRLYDGGGPSTTTAADGSYTLDNHPDAPDTVVPRAVPGDQTSTAAPYGFVTTRGPATTTDPGVARTVPPIVLDQAAAVGGVVTDRAGSPLAGVRVTATARFANRGRTAVTGADGTYRVDHLAPDSPVTVGFDARAATGGAARYGYLSQCWRNVVEPYPGGCAFVAAARPVPTRSGELTDGTGAALTAGGAISGVTRDSAGRPLAGLPVAVRVVDGAVLGTTRSAADGTWQVDGLRPGAYTVCSYGGPAWGTGTPYDQNCLGDHQDESRSTQLTVRADRVTRGADLLLHGFGAITGRIVDHDGHPVSALFVSWSGGRDVGRSGIAVTANDGTFRIDDHLPASTYLLCLQTTTDTAPNDGLGLAPICLSDVVVPDATVVDLGTVTVVEGGRVSGRVTDAAGYELDGWFASYTDLGTGRVVAVGRATPGTGAYTSATLAPGRYAVCVSGGRRVGSGTSPAHGFTTQCWRRQVLGSSTPVAVTSGATTPAIDFRLRANP